MDLCRIAKETLISLCFNVADVHVFGRKQRIYIFASFQFYFYLKIKQGHSNWCRFFRSQTKRGGLSNKVVSLCSRGDRKRWFSFSRSVLYSAKM